MSGGAAAGVFLGIFVILCLVVFLLYIGIRNNAGIRRREYETMRAERNSALDTVDKISKVCDEFGEMDHVVVGSIRPLIREHTETQRKLRK